MTDKPEYEQMTNAELMTMIRRFQTKQGKAADTVWLLCLDELRPTLTEMRYLMLSVERYFFIKYYGDTGRKGTQVLDDFFDEHTRNVGQLIEPDRKELFDKISHSLLVHKWLSGSTDCTTDD